MSEPEVTQPTVAVEDQAAQSFQELLPQLHKAFEALYTGQSRRVSLALIEYPFAASLPKFDTPEERLAFNLGSQALDCKFVLMRAALDMHKEMIENNLNKQGEVNGEVDTSRNNNGT